MPRMNGNGPEGKGSGTGRGLGSCKSIPEKEALQKLGKGMGKRFWRGGGSGKAKRLQSGLK